jgi:hypothetical protein
LEPFVGTAELPFAPARELDDVAATVGGIAATRDERAFLELVEKSDYITWIQAEGVGERLLARRSAFAEKLERNQVTGAKATRLERDFGSATPDAGEVLDQGEQPLVRRRLRPRFGHPKILHEIPMICI